MVISGCYMYSRLTKHVNEKRLPPLFGKTGRRSPEEESRSHSIPAPRNRSGAELRAESQRYLGSVGNRRAPSELPHIPHGGMARSKKTNRALRLGKAGQDF